MGPPEDPGTAGMKETSESARTPMAAAMAVDGIATIPMMAASAAVGTPTFPTTEIGSALTPTTAPLAGPPTEGCPMTVAADRGTVRAAASS